MRKKRTAIQRDAENWAKAILEQPEGEAAQRGLMGPDSEAERMRRVPGIVFVDGAVGHRARVAATGIEVFEVIEDYLLYGRADLPLVYDWLTPEQLDAAVAYYEAYPEEIDRLLALGDVFKRKFDRHAG